MKYRVLRAYNFRHLINSIFLYDTVVVCCQYDSGFGYSAYTFEGTTFVISMDGNYYEI